MPLLARRTILLVAVLLVALPAVAPGATFPSKPERENFFVDEAGLIAAPEREAINTIAGDLLRQEKVPILVVTIPSLVARDAAGHTIERYAYELFPGADEHGQLILRSEEPFGAVAVVQNTTPGNNSLSTTPTVRVHDPSVKLKLHAQDVVDRDDLAMVDRLADAQLDLAVPLDGIADDLRRGQRSAHRARPREDREDRITPEADNAASLLLDGTDRRAEGPLDDRRDLFRALTAAPLELLRECREAGDVCQEQPRGELFYVR